MIIALCSIALAIEPTRTPVAKPADEISAEEAYRLAAEAYGKYAALEKRYGQLKVGDPKVAAQMASLEKRVHEMECAAGADDATCPERPAATITVTAVEAVEEDLVEVEADISRLEALEAREATLVTGIGVQGGVQPPIPGLTGPVWLGVTAVVATCNEDAYGGFCLGGNGSLSNDATYGLGAEYVRYRKGPHGRFAWGYGVIGGADFVHGIGQPKYDAYHGGIGGQTYLRFTLSERERNGRHVATDLVVAPLATFGQVAVPGSAAFEARAGLRIYIQRRTGVGGKIAEPADEPAE